MNHNNITDSDLASVSRILQEYAKFNQNISNATATQLTDKIHDNLSYAIKESKNLHHFLNVYGLSDQSDNGNITIQFTDDAHEKEVADFVAKCQENGVSIANDGYNLGL